MRQLLPALLPATLLIAIACTQANVETDPPELDFAAFRCRVQPVLVKQCAAPACHGNGDRYFRLYARNRLRFGVGDLERASPLTEAEVRANYDAARALVTGLGAAEDSMLVKKPLEEEAGGYYHGATQTFRTQGYNVFVDQADPEYEIIRDWALGDVADPNCTDPGAMP
jgi:hypothetical protein